jgi:predicted DNA-binding protein (MmcQ/YjbR family)
LVEPERFSRETIENFVRHSYELVRATLSKRLQAGLVAKESK